MTRPRLAVIGAGTMGRGIAQLALQAGCTAVLIDAHGAALGSAVASLRELFGSLAAKGRLAQAPEELLARLTTGQDVAAAAEADWVIEAVPEDLALKRAVFRELADAVPAARLATNTSTLSVTAIASSCSRPADVIGLHFFNPPGLMRLVEVVPGVATRSTLVEEAVTLARLLGREPVVASDSPGFIVNRLARPYYLEALRLHAEGVPCETCDAAMRAAGFPMGPFELLDLIGLDVNLASSISVYHAFFEEPRFRPHPLQQRMVDAGRLGRKVGRGFYRYDERGRRTEDSGAVEQPRSVGQAAATGGVRGQPVDRAAGPTFTVLGTGPVASLLRERLPSPATGARPDLTLDASLSPGPLDTPTTAVVLTWGRSASSASSDSHVEESTEAIQPRPVIGFSLVPGTPTTDQLTLELLVPSAPEAAAEATVATATLTAAGVRVLHLPDHPGGVAFRIVALLINEAVAALAEGLAERGAIDTAMRLGVNYPLGPLEWAERLGLANVMAALDSLHRETGAERFAPHPLLRRLVALGQESFPASAVHHPPPDTALSDTMRR